MEGMMYGLKLPKLADRTPVRLIIMVPPGLKAALSEYADAYFEAYGRREPVEDLIPAILASFLESDRAFARRRKERGPRRDSGDDGD
jgi:hypothetical protein